MEQDYALSTMGSVVLPSGCWQWTVCRRPHLHYLLFRHHEKPRDEMQAVVCSGELTQERVAAAAADPLHRVWADQDGLIWRITLEIPSLPCSGRWLFEEGMTMVFTRGQIRREARVPNETGIGELTCQQLATLLYGVS